MSLAMRNSAILSLAISAAIIGCGDGGKSRPTSLNDRYGEIQGGMSLSEVRAILGPGRKLTKADDLDLHVPGKIEGESLIWQDEQTSITIVFDEGIAVAKLRAVAPARRE